MREIPLTQGKVAYVDDDIFHLLKAVPFHAMKVKDKVYARCNRELLPGKRHTYLHWIVIAPSFHKSFQIRFKNGNTLDCQRDNLEYIEKRINTQQNSKRQKNRPKRSKYLGVTKVMSPRLKSDRWAVRIKHEGKMLCFGRFRTEEAAALAYNEKVVELYGPNAKINQLTPTTK